MTASRTRAGFAHGVAGIGFALRELHDLVGEERFLRAANAAFDLERTWFRRRDGGWPDLRGVERSAGWDAPATAGPTWCNGVGGIALSRVRAVELVGSDADRADARAALGSTRAAARALDARTLRDFSLCHGAAGIGDVLLRAGDRDLASHVGALGIALCDGSVAALPCGVRAGSTPALLLGLAGIGHFYLRLCDDATPSPLLICRGDP